MASYFRDVCMLTNKREMLLRVFNNSLIFYADILFIIFIATVHVIAASVYSVYIICLKDKLFYFLKTIKDWFQNLFTK